MRSLWGILLVVLLSLPGWADFALGDLQIKKVGQEVKVVVSLQCSDVNDCKLSLFIRSDPTSPWEPIAAWTDLKPGSCTRVFCSEGNDRVRQLVARTRFEIKARVQQGERYTELARAYVAPSTPRN